jgi:hypothetical protein
VAILEVTRTVAFVQHISQLYYGILTQWIFIQVRTGIDTWTLRRFGWLLSWQDVAGNRPETKTWFPKATTPTSMGWRFFEEILGGPGRNRTTGTRIFDPLFMRPGRPAKNSFPSSYRCSYGTRDHTYWGHWLSRRACRSPVWRRSGSVRNKIYLFPVALLFLAPGEEQDALPAGLDRELGVLARLHGCDCVSVVPGGGHTSRHGPICHCKKSGTL